MASLLDSSDEKNGEERTNWSTTTDIWQTEIIVTLSVSEGMSEWVCEWHPSYRPNDKNRDLINHFLKFLINNIINDSFTQNQEKTLFCIKLYLCYAQVLFI